MIKERNYKLTLDAQILEIREQIRLGNQSFPIDIVETIGNDSQVYYELPNGYWERYEYDADGTVISYNDSNDVKVQCESNPDFDLMFQTIMRTIAMGQLKSDLTTDSYKIGLPVEQKPCLIDEIIGELLVNEQRLMIKEAEEDKQDKARKELKTLVYLVEQNDVQISDNVPYINCHNNFFITEAKRQGNVYTIKAYQNQMNLGEISMVSKLIRFI